MIVGKVHPGGDAVMRVSLRGPSQIVDQLEVVIDTGFNDWLTLPAARIDALGLPWREQMTYTLADASAVTVHIFKAEIEWFGRWRQVFVTEIEGGPLLGMAMLQGARLTMDVVDGGDVLIEPLAE